MTKLNVFKARLMTNVILIKYYKTQGIKGCQDVIDDLSNRFGTEFVAVMGYKWVWKYLTKRGV